MNTRLVFLLACGAAAAFTGPAGVATRPNFAARNSALRVAAGGFDGAAPLKAPPALFEGAVALGAKKAASPPARTFVLATVAGAHIAFGSLLALSIGGHCTGIAAANPGLAKIITGAFGLPFGLMMVLCTGGELVTGNMALCAAARLEGKTTTGAVLKNWAAAFSGNFVGALVVLKLAMMTATVTTPAAAAIAVAKTSKTFAAAFAGGVLCNWLVTMAVYMASGCSDLVSKMVAIWFPISAFVALGFEHSVANMFMIPLGMAKGAEVTVGTFLLKNLLPVTLGNIAGAVLFTVLPFWVAFGRSSE